MDLKDAPPTNSEKDKMKETIKNKSEELLGKYFEGRIYNKEKFNKYKIYFLEESTGFLNNNYKNFGFVLAFIGFNAGNLRINHEPIFRNETDDCLFSSICAQSTFCEIRIYFIKLYSSLINNLENIESNIILKMDEILTNKLEGKEYSYEFAKNSVTTITSELSQFLLQRKIDKIPCSYSICYIMEKPYDFIFDYKVLNLKYIPLMASYSNDSLGAKLMSFILNN